MVPSTKINLPENLNLYCQVYCQVVPPTKINSIKISRITVKNFIRLKKARSDLPESHLGSKNGYILEQYNYATPGTKVITIKLKAKLTLH